MEKNYTGFCTCIRDLSSRKSQCTPFNHFVIHCFFTCRANCFFRNDIVSYLFRYDTRIFVNRKTLISFPSRQQSIQGSQSLRGLGSSSLVDSPIVNPAFSTLNTTINDLTSLLRPSSGSSSTAFAVSLLAFGVALGTTYGQQTEQSNATTATSTTLNSSPKQRYYCCYIEKHLPIFGSTLP